MLLEETLKNMELEDVDVDSDTFDDFPLVHEIEVLELYNEYLEDRHDLTVKRLALEHAKVVAEGAGEDVGEVDAKLAQLQEAVGAKIKAFFKRLMQKVKALWISFTAKIKMLWAQIKNAFSKASKSDYEKSDVKATPPLAVPEMKKQAAAIPKYVALANKTAADAVSAASGKKQAGDVKQAIKDGVKRELQQMKQDAKGKRKQAKELSGGELYTAVQEATRFSQACHKAAAGLAKTVQYLEKAGTTLSNKSDAELGALTDLGTAVAGALGWYTGHGLLFGGWAKGVAQRVTGKKKATGEDAPADDEFESPEWDIETLGEDVDTELPKLELDGELELPELDLSLEL